MSRRRTLVDVIDAWSPEDRDDRTAVLAIEREGRRDLSYGELAEAVRSTAVGLMREGVRPEEPVGVMAESRPEWIVAALAVVRAGATVVPIDAQLGDEALAHVLSDSGVRHLFTTSEGADRLSRLELADEPALYLLDADAGKEEGEEEEARAARSWRRLTEPGEEGDLPEPAPDNRAALFYTSGTTGPPKGVPLEHRHLVFQLDVVEEAELIGSEDRVLLPLPLHHVYPFVIGMLAPLALGLPIVLPHALTGPEIARALGEGEVTVMIGVPRLYRALYDGIQGRIEARGPPARTAFRAAEAAAAALRRWSGLQAGKLLLRPLHRRLAPRLRILASGGSALDPDLGTKLEALGWRIAVGYGLTETAPLLTIKPPGQGPLASVGRAVRDVELRIDPSSAPAGEARGEGTERGEVQCRGPAVFGGYHDLRDKTEEAFTEDGWFRTGDLGWLDDDGYLHLAGRRSTLLVTEGGENVQPDEVEDHYAEHSLIKEIGVLESDGKLIGVAVPEAAALRDRDRDEIEAALRGAVKEQGEGLASYKRLAEVVVSRESLDRTRLGKLQRHRLEERYRKLREGEDGEDRRPMAVEEMTPEDRSLLENEASRRAWEWLAERYPNVRLTPDTLLEVDLGVDSLGWIDLTLEMAERVGVELDEEAIGRIESVRDLLEEVARRIETAGEGRGRAGPLESPEESLSDRQRRWLEPLGAGQTAAARVLHLVVTGVLRWFFALEVEGRDRLPADRRLVLTPNHCSYLDPFALAAALPFPLLRRTYWGGWTGVVFRNPFFRLVSRLAKVLPVDPDAGPMSSLALAAAVLERGDNLIWFPEGSRSEDGSLQEFKPGIGLLLARFDAAAVPVFIAGTHEALPPGSARLRRVRLRLTIGEPSGSQELIDEGEGESEHERIARALRTRVARLGGDPDG